MSLDCFFTRQYMPGSYNCLHFSVEVWKHLTGQDVSEMLGILTGRIADRKLRRSDVSLFRTVDEKTDPALLVMQVDKTVPHIGVWYKGRVFHITERGVQYTSLYNASIGFDRVRFFVPC